MARDNNHKRYIRRLKRERNLALRMMDYAIIERDMARQILRDVVVKTTETRNDDPAPAVYDPVNYPEGAARADEHLKRLNDEQSNEAVGQGSAVRPSEGS